MIMFIIQYFFKVCIMYSKYIFEFIIKSRNIKWVSRKNVFGIINNESIESNTRDATLPNTIECIQFVYTRDFSQSMMPMSVITAKQ
jgi:hypothetical protein